MANKRAMEPIPETSVMTNLIGNITPLTADESSIEELLEKSPIPTVS